MNYNTIEDTHIALWVFKLQSIYIGMWHWGDGSGCPYTYLYGCGTEGVNMSLKSIIHFMNILDEDLVFENMSWNLSDLNSTWDIASILFLFYHPIMQLKPWYKPGLTAVLQACPQCTNAQIQFCLSVYVIKINKHAFSYINCSLHHICLYLLSWTISQSRIYHQHISSLGHGYRCSYITQVISHWNISVNVAKISHMRFYSWGKFRQLRCTKVVWRNLVRRKNTSN